MPFADLPNVYLKDFGLTCVAAGGTFLGILDRPDDVLNMAGVNVTSTMYSLTAKTSDVTAAGLASGAAITVGGRAYVIRDLLSLDDGTFTNLTLSF